MGRVKEITVLEGVGELFKKFGIRSLTMADIAKELSISKKTLYKFVDNKDDLVTRAISTIVDKQEADFEKIIQQNRNPIDELLEINKLTERHLKSIHPSVVFDIQKFHPEAWSQIELNKESHIYISAKNNLEKGKKEGLYREDINTNIVANFFISRFDIIFNHKMFPYPDFELSEVNREMILYHLYAILTPKGIKQLKKYDI